MASTFRDSRIDADGEEEWRPPTEAEMKVIEARRERSDRIAQLMGSYLLKGYKMLASQCPKCQSIELQDKQGRLYCVACEEVDPEIRKDNPVFSEEAASSQRAESQYASEQDQDYERACSTFSTHLSSLMESSQTETKIPQSSLPQLQEIQEPPPAIIQATSRQIVSETPRTSVLAVPDPVPQAELVDDCAATLQAVRGKLAWARENLKQTTDITDMTNYVKLLTHCAECISALKKAMK